jgi:hypothetical protein
LCLLLIPVFAARFSANAADLERSMVVGVLDLAHNRGRNRRELADQLLLLLLLNHLRGVRGLVLRLLLVVGLVLLLEGHRLQRAR